MDLKKLKIINIYGKELKIKSYGGRAPTVSLRGRNFSVVEVIGVWMGMDVIDKCCFFKDGDKLNYHPGNLIWTTKEKGVKWSNYIAPRNSKLNREMVKFIRSFNLTGTGVSVQDLADTYGVSFHTIKNIRAKSKRYWQEVDMPRGGI